MKEIKQLTRKQALKKGYEYVVDKNTSGFQRLTQIEELTDEDILNGNFVLAQQKANQVPVPDGKRIAGILGDNIQEQWCDITGDDDPDIYNIVSNMDFSEVTKAIEEKLAHIWYRTSTEIYLIP